MHLINITTAAPTNKKKPSVSPSATILIAIITLILFPLLFLIAFFIVTPIIISAPMLVIAHISFPTTGSGSFIEKSCEFFFVGLLSMTAIALIDYSFTSELFFNVNVLNKSLSDTTMSFITKSLVILSITAATVASIVYATYLVDRHFYSIVPETTKTSITNTLQSLFNSNSTDKIAQNSTQVNELIEKITQQN